MSEVGDREIAIQTIIVKETVFTSPLPHRENSHPRYTYRTDRAYRLPLSDEMVESMAKAAFKGYFRAFWGKGLKVNKTDFENVREDWIAAIRAAVDELVKS